MRNNIIKRYVYKTALLTAIGWSAFSSTTYADGANLPLSGQEQGKVVSLASSFVKSDDGGLLSPMEAFAPEITISDKKIAIRFSVQDGYYLYKDKLQASGDSSGWQFSKEPLTVKIGQESTEVFTGSFVAVKDISGVIGAKNNLSLSWQGCAKGQTCYPPETINLAVSERQSVYKTHEIERLIKEKGLEELSNPSNTNKKNQSLDENKKSPEVSISETSEKPYNKEEFSFWKLVENGSFVGVFVLFALGLGLSLTPCVYPMVPILANIVAGSNRMLNPRKGFYLSLSYGLGVATSYGVLGALIAWFGRSIGIGAWFQQPVVLVLFASLFLLYASVMFGWINVKLPAKISDFMHQKSRMADDRLGGVAGSYLVGFLSALVVSPCVSAPMAGALTAASISGSVLFGFFGLFALGLGMSVPLIVLGSLQGRLLPKAGEWMNDVKSFFGLLLVLVSFSIFARLLSEASSYLLYATWFLILSVWLWRSKNVLGPSLAAISIVVALLMGLKVSNDYKAMGPSIFTQSAQLNKQVFDRIVTSQEELTAIMSTEKDVIVDFYADWCVECRRIDREIFADMPNMDGRYLVVKVDVSKDTPDSRAILSQYRLHGPPAIIIQKNGVVQQKLLGGITRDEFVAAVANN